MVSLGPLQFLLCFAGLSSLVLADHPRTNARVSNWTSIEALQLAANTEQLELAAINGLLDKYSQDDFAKANYPSWVRDRLLQMQKHDQVHLGLITEILNQQNASVPSSCHWSFVDLVLNIEGVEGALIGLCGIKQVTESAYLGLVREFEESLGFAETTAVFAAETGRHQSWILSAVLHEDPWSGPWDTVATADQTAAFYFNVFSDSCPDPNPKLPTPGWTPASVIFDGMIASEYDGPAGLPAQVTYAGVENNTAGETWINIQSGLGIEVVEVGQNGTFTVPANLQGFSYGMIISTNQTRYSAEAIVAGPIAFHNGFNSTVPNPGLAPMPLR